MNSYKHTTLLNHTENILGHDLLFFQPKLTINAPGDRYEQEADTMADKVMRMEQPFIQARPLPVAVCPDFWSFGSLDQQLIGLIHEVLHMTHGMGDRDTAPFAQTAGQRRGEPECYASLVADIYGIAPQDPSCPVI